MYVFVCITRLTSWVASKQPQMWAYTPPTKSSKQSSEWIVFARVPTCYATRHCRRRCCRRISSLSFLITPQFAMLDLHTTRFIHDHDSSWHDKLIRRRSIWRIRCLVRTPLSLSHCSIPAVLCVSFSRVHAFWANCCVLFYLSYFQCAFSFLSVAFVLLKLGWFASLLLLVFLLSLLFCLFCVLKFSRLFVVHWSHTMCLKIVSFPLCCFCWAGVCAYILFLYWSLCFVYLFNKWVCNVCVCVPHCVSL